MTAPKPITDDPVAFPKFTPEEIALTFQQGEDVSFHAGEDLLEAGVPDHDAFFIAEGEAEVIDISGDQQTRIVTLRPGDFTGDIDLLTGRRSVVKVRALTPVRASRIRNADLRPFLIKNPAIADRLIQAFIRRRALLNETGFQGIRIYGHKDCPRTLQIQEFCFRNGIPHTWMNIEEPEIAARLKPLNLAYEDLPYLAYGDIELLRNPSLAEISEHIGIQRKVKDKCYDTIIIGAGPSGLGAAVYASSEGLDTLVIDTIGPGGQAGSSSKIENYAGFPEGLSGRELALRSYLQALKFGVDFLAPCQAHKITTDADTGLHHITLCTGETAVTKTIIVSTGISYRKLKVDGMNRLQGSGVYYNATQIEAILCRQKSVHIIGAGNSAGQAAMYLSSFASQVNLLVRGTDINKSMSEYLSSRVLQNPRIKIRYRQEMRAISGEDHIQTITVLNKNDDTTTTEETCGVFIFIGGTPSTDFLPDTIARDRHGFLLAGTEVANHPSWTLDRNPCSLETTIPGIFVSGDCRSGTTKRVAFAIGDGALAVTCVHDYLGTYN